MEEKYTIIEDADDWGPLYILVCLYCEKDWEFIFTSEMDKIKKDHDKECTSVRL